MEYHLAAVFFTLSIYVFLGVAYFGWGNVLLLVPGLKGLAGEKRPVAFTVWLGWSATLFLFQVIHFFLPLHVYAVAPVFILGVAFSIPFLAAECGNFPVELFTRRPFITATAVVAVLSATVWIASRAMLPPQHYDSGLYHLNAVRWYNSYAIVPGLGNLHGRFAFNPSFFTYVAALNFHPFFRHGRSIANSFLLILTAATLIEMAIPLLKRHVRDARSEPFEWGTALFAFPILIYLALVSFGVASPSPDLATSLLQIVIFAMLVRALGEYMETKRVSRSTIFIVGVVAATSATIKLSSLVFAAVSSAIVLAVAWKNSEARIRETALMLIPAALIMIVYCARGFVLSGAPLYPSTVGYFPADWSVPVESVIDEAKWVYAWARQPNANPDQVLGNWNWLGPWLRSTGMNFTDVVYPLAVFLISFLTSAALSLFWKAPKRFFFQWIVLLPLAAGLVFWFFTAPAARFAQAIFLLLPVSGVALLLSLVQDRVKGRAFWGIVLVLFIAGNFHIIKHTVKYSRTVKYFSTDGWSKTKEAPLEEKATESGLRVFKPKKGDQCWDSPLPCTPYFKEALRLRNPDDMSSGFTVR